MEIIISEEDFKSSKYITKEWSNSVIVTYWEHDFEKKNYTIKLNIKNEE